MASCQNLSLTPMHAIFALPSVRNRAQQGYPKHGYPKLSLWPVPFFLAFNTKKGRVEILVFRLSGVEKCLAGLFHETREMGGAHEGASLCLESVNLFSADRATRSVG